MTDHRALGDQYEQLRACKTGAVCRGVEDVLGGDRPLGHFNSNAVPMMAGSS